MEIRRKLSITGEYEESDVGYIIDQLVSFNLSNAPTAQVPPSEDINLILRDQDGLVLGGVLGKMYRFALYIHVLWVSEELRGQGYGSRLLHEIESQAQAKGCKLVHLDTWNFQAPEFYVKHGFEIFGTLEGFPEGTKRHFLRKEIG
ncbi:GNAT family N-acetyltransferase [Paenibacillus oralis]|nr:GNAT family N-acetyltransferase [Paenibacillus oralis]